MSPADKERNLGDASLQGAVFEPGYRLCATVERDGTIRQVVDAQGIGAVDPAALVGIRVQALASSGARGAERAAVWDERLAHAAQTSGAAHYSDLPPHLAEGERTIGVTVTPINLADGSLDAILVQSHDLEPGRLADRRLRESEAQLRTALAVAGMGRYVVYFRERRVDCDERFSEIIGHEANALMAAEGLDGFFRIIHPEDVHKVRRALNRAMTTEEDYSVEYRVRLQTPKGPTVRWVAAFGRVESDAEGPLRIVGVLDDITNRRADDHAQARSQKLEAIGTLVGGIAHDFNNVISAILSNASMAERELRAGDSPITSIEEIERGARRAGELVKRMLASSREEEPTRVSFDLGEVAREAVALLRPTLAASVELNLRIHEPLEELYGDPSQLHQVLMNLITNAAQAIGDSPGQIDLTVDDFALIDHASPVPSPGPDEYLRVRVRDDGPGLPGSVIGRIFDPFFTTKPVGKGTGLGLAVSQTIVRAHGGTLSVDSAVGEGTTFTVLIPAGPLIGEPPVLGRAEEGVMLPTPEGHARVLFVDDEEAMTHLASRAMPVGCSVVALTDPAAALDVLAATPEAFDVLVTEQSLRGMTGLELARLVRSVRPNLPVVLTTGLLTEREREEAAADAIDLVVEKPCSLDDLSAAAVRVVAERRAADSPGPARVAGTASSRSPARG